MGNGYVDLYEFLKEFVEHVYIFGHYINEVKDVDVAGFGCYNFVIVPFIEGSPVKKFSSTLPRETRDFLGGVFWKNALILE